ncbi:YxcD family protein [Paenibacillus sp. GYB004]|uniref:YxcD family protein n=1 Tax=Paenibacillus sp. GYB004 TaxID=2994393 RepID=UPI002F96A2D5
MILNEQEIINAICTHMAERKGVQPAQVNVQLEWDESLGFSAEVTIDGRSQYIVEANMLEAIERYMLSHFDRRVFRSDLELDVEDEMFCRIKE